MTELKEFVISRLLDAPRERVWRAWTDQKEMDQWFGPKGMATVQSKGEFKAGGVRLVAMKGPDGKVGWNRAAYREITPPSKLVWVTSFSDENGGLTRHPMAPTWPLEMLTTVILEEKEGKTLLTVRWMPINSSDEENQTFMAGFEGMKGGWGGTFERLEEFLATAKE